MNKPQQNNKEKHERENMVAVNGRCGKERGERENKRGNENIAKMKENIMEEMGR